MLGLLKTIVVGVLILILFPAQPNPSSDGEVIEPVSTSDRRLGLILVLALIAFATDFLHGISPAWISLAAAVVCMVPVLGLFGRRDFTKVNFASLVYFAGIFGLGALVAASGWGARLGDVLTQMGPLDPAQPLANFIVLSGTAMVVGLGTTLPGVPVILTPLATDLASLSSLSLESTLMTQVVGFSTPLLPYQAPPLVIAMQLAGIRLIDGARLLLAIAAATIVILLPLDFLWWRILGMI